MKPQYVNAGLICLAFLTLVIPEGNYRRSADIGLIGIALAAAAWHFRRRRKQDV